MSSPTLDIVRLPKSFLNPVGMKRSLSHFFFFLLLRGAPVTYGSSQARSRIGAAAAGHSHSHSNVGSELHLQLVAMPDPFNSLSEARD